MIIALTQEERDKFAAWLEQSAKSDTEMAEQMGKLAGSNAVDAVAKRMKQRATTYSIVAKELREIESATYGA